MKVLDPTHAPFKKILLDRVPAYKDPFRAKHDKNMAAIKKEKKIEKRFLKADMKELVTEQIREEKIVLKLENQKIHEEKRITKLQSEQQRLRLLNII